MWTHGNEDLLEENRVIHTLKQAHHDNMAILFPTHLAY